MRRGVGILVLAVVVVGAVWCVDGCLDPTDRNGPVPSTRTYTCTVCVMPFATVPPFSLPEQQQQIRAVPDATVVHLWAAPVHLIDHPPRLL